MSAAISNRVSAHARIHMTRDAYEEERRMGRLWCWLGRHFVSAACFARDRSRTTGRFAICRSCDSKRRREGGVGT